MNYVAISKCPKCESTDLAGYDDDNPARMQCRDCTTKMKPCSKDDCDDIRILTSTDYMKEWECNRKRCSDTILEDHD